MVSHKSPDSTPSKLRPGALVLVAAVAVAIVGGVLVSTGGINGAERPPDAALQEVHRQVDAQSATATTTTTRGGGAPAAPAAATGTAASQPTPTSDPSAASQLGAAEPDAGAPAGIPPAEPGAGPAGPLGTDEPPGDPAIEAAIAVPGAPIPSAWLAARVDRYRARVGGEGRTEPTTLLVEELLPPAVCASLDAPPGSRVLEINGVPPGAVGALDALAGPAGAGAPGAGPAGGATRPQALRLKIVRPDGGVMVVERPLAP